jgi:hypothetical protein
MASKRRQPPKDFSAEAMAALYNRCPKNHQLPHSVEGFGSCSPIRCAKDVAKKVEMDEIARAAQEAREAKIAANGPEAREEAKKEAVAARVQMQRSVAREIARRRLVPMPEGLSGADAESYVERKLVELSVDAVAELEYQLKFLDDDHRRDAAARILDSTGHGKKDRTAGGANLIIIQAGNGSGPIPPVLMNIASIPAALNPNGPPSIPSLPRIAEPPSAASPMPVPPPQTHKAP